MHRHCIITRAMPGVGLMRAAGHMSLEVFLAALHLVAETRWLNSGALEAGECGVRGG